VERRDSTKRDEEKEQASANSEIVNVVRYVRNIVRTHKTLNILSKICRTHKTRNILSYFRMQSHLCGSQ
jgi:hypothetical protein